MQQKISAVANLSGHKDVPLQGGNDVILDHFCGKKNFFYIMALVR